MRAIVSSGPGGPDTLSLAESEDPVATSRDLLVRVGATALNRADIHQREGRYPPPPGASEILGLEMAGVIEGVGDEVVGWSVGDRVLALLPGGGYAERVAVRADHAIRVPDALTMIEAAAIAEAFLTAYQALFVLAGTDPGDPVLIHAGGSGVGTAAIQLARVHGLRPFVTCSASKRQACIDLGAEIAIDYRTERFRDVVTGATDGTGVRLVIDVIGAPYLEDNVDVLALDGHIVILATMGGAVAEAFDLRRLFRRRGSIVCSTLRNRTDAYKADLVSGFVRDFMPLFETGDLRPVIDSVVPWDRVADAHRRLEAGLNVGKIVLVVDPSVA